MELLQMIGAAYSQYNWDEEKEWEVNSPASSHRQLARQVFSLAKRFKYEGDSRSAWQATNAGRKMLLLASKEEKLWRAGMFLSKDLTLLASRLENNSANSINITNPTDKYNSQVKQKKAGPVDIRGSECIISIPHMRYILDALKSKNTEPKEVI